LVIAGPVDDNNYFRKLQSQARRLGVDNQVDFLGPIDERGMIRCYANARGVVFVPRDEDYGYVTLEAMLSAKPVITVTDSGGPLEFVNHGVEGLISEPTASALGMAFDQLFESTVLAQTLGAAGLQRYHSQNISWQHVVKALTGCKAPEPTENESERNVRKQPKAGLWSVKERAV
jgi:glycosyltransferase involved in cell wall biosynthesis